MSNSAETCRLSKNLLIRQCEGRQPVTRGASCEYIKDDEMGIGNSLIRSLRPYGRRQAGDLVQRLSRRCVAPSITLPEEACSIPFQSS